MLRKAIIIICLTLFMLSYAISQSFNIEWQGCFGGSNTEYPKDIVSVLNGYLVTGSTKSNNGDISFNHGLTDAWVFKIDNDGLLIWEKTYGGSNGDNSKRILSDGQGNYYIVGATNSGDGDVSYDPYPNSWDFWIIKIDSIGNIIWEKVLGGTGDEVMWTSTLTDDGGVVAFGWTGSDDGDISIAYGGYDMWMVKLNSEGEKEWDFSIGTDNLDFGQVIIQTSDGGFLIGGSSSIGEGGNLICTPHSWAAEAILVKLDANLNIEWQQCYGGSDHDGATALAEVSDGYVFGGGAGSNDGDISGWHGEVDIWIVKVDFNGNIIWQRCLGGSRLEGSSKLIITVNEDIIISGSTQSIDGDVTGNHTISEHEHDIWIVKLSGDGDLIWEQCFGGIWDEQVNFGFLKKSENNFVIAGQTDFGPSFDVACLPHGGEYDKDFWVFEVKDTTTNISTYMNENEIKVYPNPAREYVVFEIQGLRTKNEEILIRNTYGQRIASLQIKDEKTVWDTRAINNGIYFYSLESDNRIYNGKIIVQK